MPPHHLELSRDQVLAHRRSAGGLDARLPAGPGSLRRAAWAGLQDSVPRAALHSLHARVEAVAPTTLQDASLVQLWGPRFSAYVVAAGDRGVFTLGRLPEDGERRRFGEEIAARLEAFLAGRRMPYGAAGRALGVHPNALRYAAPTGRVLIAWDGARQPTIWTVPPPDLDEGEARLELARRHLHVLGPATPAEFAEWAGIRPGRVRATWDALADSVIPVRTPIGDGWILAADEEGFRGPAAPPAAARLLPSGDAWFLFRGPDRALLVPDAARRATLWTPRVWPGAVLVAGEIAGTWRRAESTVTIDAWRALTSAERGAVEAEATTLPVPGAQGPAAVAWRQPPA